MHWIDGIPHPETVGGWTLLLAAFSLLGLLGLWQQLRDARRRFRAEVEPYLRIDLAPAHIEGTWTPRREPDTELTYEAINGGVSPPGSAMDQWEGEVPIYLWVENTQSAVGGIADRIKLLLEFGFPDRNDSSIEWQVEKTVVFAYLEPGHLNRYEVARVSETVPWMTGAVTGVRYSDMFGQWSSWAHGSAEFEWTPPGIEHTRRAFRARTGLRGTLDRVQLRLSQVREAIRGDSSGS